MRFFRLLGLLISTVDGLALHFVLYHWCCLFFYFRLNRCLCLLLLRNLTFNFRFDLRFYFRLDLCCFLYYFWLQIRFNLWFHLSLYFFFDFTLYIRNNLWFRFLFCFFGLDLWFYFLFCLRLELFRFRFDLILYL